MPPLADMSLIGLAGLTAPLLAQLPVDPTASPMGWGEYGIVGLTVALALYALRESSNRRIDDAKDYAADIKQIQESRIQESRQNHDAQMTLLLRLLDGRSERKEP